MPSEVICLLCGQLEHGHPLETCGQWSRRFGGPCHGRMVLVDDIDPDLLRHVADMAEQKRQAVVICAALQRGGFVPNRQAKPKKKPKRTR